MILPFIGPIKLEYSRIFSSHDPSRVMTLEVGALKPLFETSENSWEMVLNFQVLSKTGTFGINCMKCNPFSCVEKIYIYWGQLLEWDYVFLELRRLVDFNHKSLLPRVKYFGKGMDRQAIDGMWYLSLNEKAQRLRPKRLVHSAAWNYKVNTFLPHLSINKSWQKMWRQLDHVTVPAKEYSKYENMLAEDFIDTVSKPRQQTGKKDRISSSCSVELRANSQDLKVR